MNPSVNFQYMCVVVCVCACAHYTACTGLYHKPISLSHFFFIVGKYEVIAGAINSDGFAISPLDLVVNKSKIFMLVSAYRSISMKTRMYREEEGARAKESECGWVSVVMG